MLELLVWWDQQQQELPVRLLKRTAFNCAVKLQQHPKPTRLKNNPISQSLTLAFSFSCK